MNKTIGGCGLGLGRPDSRPETAEPLRPVPAALERVNEALRALQDRMTGLEARLVPVLRVVDNKNEDPFAAVPGSGLTAELLRDAQTIEHVNERIEQLLERLEL